MISAMEPSYSPFSIPINGPTLRIKPGKIQGRYRKNYRGVRYLSFQGIPYAKPPLGNLRFKAPEKIDAWGETVLDCTRERSCCYQRHVIHFEEIGHEDCLYLNVFTPKIIKSSPLYPVIVLIHGGAFVSGSSDTEFYQPEYILTEEIVLVTFNYRLGMFGFISFLDNKIGIPGNAGLKDQVLALKWVRENIEKFRGDPNNVTLFGCDAGAASAHLHMLSPMSKGLFNKVILFSGSALNPWVNGIRGSARLMAVAFGIDPNDEAAILNCLMKASSEEIFAAQQKITNLCAVNDKWVCSPVIETQMDAFLRDEPLKIILSRDYNHVPMIIGYTSSEGIGWDVFNRQIFGKSDTITDFSTVIPNNLHVKKEQLLCRTMEKQIMDFYYGPRMQRSRMGRYPRVQKKEPMYQMLTDVFFLRGIHCTVKHHVATSRKPVYYFRFSYESPLNFFKKMLPSPQQRKYKGATHGDHIGYTFKIKIDDRLETNPELVQIINKVTSLWINFAKFGDPKTADVPWYPVRGTEFQFLEIGPKMTLGFFPDFDRMRFWDEIYRNDKRTANL